MQDFRYNMDMVQSVKLGMARKKSKIKILQEQLDLDGFLLFSSAKFMEEKVNLKLAEINFLVKQLQENWDDEKFSRLQTSQLELDRLIQRLNWEARNGDKFNENLKKLEELQNKKFISDLSNRLLFGNEKSKKLT